MSQRMCAVQRRMSAAFAAGLVLLAVGATARAAGGEPSFKIGLARLVLSGATYTHEDLLTTTKQTNADPLSGAELFLEWVASDHFGIEIATTVAPLQRSYKLGTTPAVSDNVSESATYTTAGANLYLTRATRKGFQALIGVATGTLNVKHEFEGGTLGTASSSASFPINTVKLGVEWVTEMAGVRLHYVLASGASSNTTELPNVKQTVSYVGGISALGVYAFF